MQELHYQRQTAGPWVGLNTNSKTPDEGGTPLWPPAQGTQGIDQSHPAAKASKDTEVTSQLKIPSPTTVRARYPADRWEEGREGLGNWAFPQRGCCQQEKELLLVARFNFHPVPLHFPIRERQRAQSNRRNYTKNIKCAMLLTRLSVVHVIFNPRLYY